MGFLVVIVLVAIVALAVVLAVRGQQSKRTQAKVLAARLGLHLDLEPSDPPQHDFDLFQAGDGGRVTYRLSQPEGGGTVFEYRYTEWSGKQHVNHHHTCALVETGLAAPHTEIGPEGFFSGLGRLVGMRDIELASPGFDERYRVTGDDEQFAVALLDEPMRDWLLRQRGRTVKAELRGPWLLCIDDEMAIDDLPAFLDWATDLRDRIPATVIERYGAR